MPEGGRRPTREAVRARAHGVCEYCRSQERFATHPFSVEHIIPVQAGGDHSLDNLCLACQGCNNHKYTKTDAIDPVTSEIVALFHPRQHRWLDHFIWSHDYSHILGRTSTGRATVEALRLNRPGLVALRSVLVERGKHPPAEPP
jgi:hypothetical protein